jgi:hypothetical protein
VDRDKHSCIVEIIAVATEACNNTVAHQDQTRSLQKSPTNKVASGVIGSKVIINNNRVPRDVCQSRELDSVEFVLTCERVRSSNRAQQIV